MAKHVLTENFSEPLIQAINAKVDIHVGDGNLILDCLTEGDQVLASGALQYIENQDLPTHSLDSSSGQVTLTLRGTNRIKPWFRFPWDACNGATLWQVHLNPRVSCDLTACSNGGNLSLDLADMAVTRLFAETGGGNIDVVLPEDAADIHVTVKTGGGNVTVDLGSDIRGSSIVEAGSGAGSVVVHVPGGVAARIHASTGLGKAIIDPRFLKTEKNTYQSPDFDSASTKIEITAGSGAGNVIVDCK
jgi:hypothetical protein